MKKLLCFVLCFALALGMLGCTRTPSVPENAITVYYKRANVSYGAQDSVISTAYLDTAGHEDDLAYLLNMYFQSTPGDGFAVTFPAELFLVVLKVEGLTAKVVLSDHIATLSGMDLTVACVCLTQTVMALTGCQEVIISAITAKLDGRDFITLSRDSYLLLDDSGSSQ